VQLLAELGWGFVAGGNAHPSSKVSSRIAFVTHQLAETSNRHQAVRLAQSTSRGSACGPQGGGGGLPWPPPMPMLHAPQRAGGRWAGGPGGNQLNAVRCADHAVA